MLNDFNKAQDLLKIKITELATQLAESETKFKNRTSLEEDIQLIAQLQVSCTLQRAQYIYQGNRK